MIYIAAPYTKPDPVTNTKRAIDLWNDLADLGYYAYCPHVSMFLHFTKERPIEFWYKYDLAMLEHCVMLARLVGESSGADAEVQHARAMGIHIIEGTHDEIVQAVNRYMKPGV